MQSPEGYTIRQKSINLDEIIKTGGHIHPAVEIYAGRRDRVLWYWRFPFRVVRITQVGYGNQEDRNPFYLPTEALISAKSDDNRWVVDSGAPRLDLVYNGNAPNLYEGYFIKVNEDGSPIEGEPEIDPHISIHPRI